MSCAVKQSGFLGFTLLCFRIAGHFIGSILTAYDVLHDGVLHSLMIFPLCLIQVCSAYCCSVEISLSFVDFSFAFGSKICFGKVKCLSNTNRRIWRYCYMGFMSNMFGWIFTSFVHVEERVAIDLDTDGCRLIFFKKDLNVVI